MFLWWMSHSTIDGFRAKKTLVESHICDGLVRAKRERILAKSGFKVRTANATPAQSRQESRSLKTLQYFLDFLCHKTCFCAIFSLKSPGLGRGTSSEGEAAMFYFCWNVLA